MVCIPEEIVKEILLNLPVKAVLRLRCVSKSWRSLTGSKRFIKSHLQISKKEAVIVYLVRFYERAKYRYSLGSLFEKEQVRHMTAPPLPPHLNKSSPYIMGCSNGLVCLNVCREYIFLCNPSTRTMEELPRIKNVHMIGNVGFGWEESREEYKVFALVEEDRFLPPLISARVYSSKTNSWKKLELKHKQFSMTSFSAMQLVCGKLHWLHNSCWVGANPHIGWFDLKTEMFGVIELPPDRQYMDELGVAGGCLCCFLYSRSDDPIPDSIEVWVMKEYGVRESWVTLMAVDHPFSASSINVSSSGEIMLFLSSTLVIYSPSRNLFRRASEFGFCRNIACLHIQSLVSPKVFIEGGNLSFRD